LKEEEETEGLGDGDLLEYSGDEGSRLILFRRSSADVEDILETAAAVAVPDDVGLFSALLVSSSSSEV